MKQIRGFALCLAILSVGLPATADIKSFHGAMCQPIIPFNVENIYPNAIDGVVAVNGYGHVICPLMRDRINSSTSLNSVVAEVFIPTGGEVDCTIYSQTEDGSAGDFVDSYNDSSTTPGETQLSFSLDSSSGNEGTYALWCYMTQDSQIHHVHTSEDNGATD
jgi:hypothetical protein